MFALLKLLKMKFTFLLLLLFPTLLFGQTKPVKPAKQKAAIAKEEWRVLDRSIYSIQYPTSWALSEKAELGTVFLLATPAENKEDKFKENINLMVQDLKGMDITLDKYTKISEEQVEKLVTNSKMIESKRIGSGTKQYHRLVYIGDQGAFRFKYVQHYWVISEKAYVLTFVSEEKSYDKYKNVGEKILSTFLLK